LGGYAEKVACPATCMPPDVSLMMKLRHLVTCHASHHALKQARAIKPVNLLGDRAAGGNRLSSSANW